MKHLSMMDKISAVLVAGLAGLLVAGAFALSAAGLFWWQELPIPRPSGFFAAFTVGLGSAVFFYVLWLFLAGHLFPHELLSKLGQFFRDGGDVAP